jgi:hypothetical protein
MSEQDFFTQNKFAYKGNLYVLVQIGFIYLRLKNLDFFNVTCKEFGIFFP